jgi:TrmH family RNA methyltransferase
MITSSHNPRLKLVRGLLSQSKIRRKEQKFVLEGVRLVEDALSVGILPEVVLYRGNAEDSLADLLSNLKEYNVPCMAVEPVLFDETADTDTPQGIIAICPWLKLTPPDPMDFVLIFDELRNPGNLGSALRTAAAVGVDAVIVTPGSVDPYNPKVVRGAMGAHLRVPIMQWDWEQIAAERLPLFVAEASGAISIYEQDWRQPCGIIVGGEAHGPQRQAYQLATQHVFIPMVDGESLNAAVAASVILYEVFRQRQ